MVAATLPLVLAAIGLVAYALAANPKASEVGRIAFAVGLLVAFLHLAEVRWSLP